MPGQFAVAWQYVYSAADQHIQVIDVYVSKRHNVAAATKFFEMMLTQNEVTTDLAAALLRVVGDLVPQVLHDTTWYAQIRIACDHGQLKARLRPLPHLRTNQTASTVIRGHAFVQNLRCGNFELGGWCRSRHSFKSPLRSCRAKRNHPT